MDAYAINVKKEKNYLVYLLSTPFEHDLLPYDLLEIRSRSDHFFVPSTMKFRFLLVKAVKRYYFWTVAQELYLYHWKENKIYWPYPVLTQETKNPEDLLKCVGYTVVPPKKIDVSKTPQEKTDCAYRNSDISN